MSATTLIKSLENTSSRNDKETLLETAFLGGEREFFAAARTCLDNTTTYGLKKIALIEGEDEALSSSDLNFIDFMKFAERLRKRELTGNAAIGAMHEAAQRSGIDTWNYFYRRILLKDFKAGFTETTINSVLNKIGTPEAKQYLIPIFSCQLAKNSDEHPKKMTGKKLLDVKLNGVRLVTICDISTMTVTQLTGRNGTENTNFPHLREQFTKLLPFLPVSVAFDGEVVAKTFQELMTQLNKKDANTKENKIALFDVVPLADFVKGNCKIPQKKRHENLIEFLPLIQEHKLDSITILPKIEVDLSAEEGRIRMEKFKQEVLEMARNEGDSKIIEGFMIKDASAPYVGKKGTYWLKWKPWISVDLEVVGLEIGDPEGKYANTLGALVCKGMDDGKYVETKVSTGLSDEERHFFWANPDKIVGYIVEIHADELTQNDKMKGSNNYSLRFPSFNALRGTEPHQKL